MQRLIGVVAIVGAILVAAGVGTWVQVQAYCQPERAQYRFGFGFAALKDRLGATMGEPIECIRTHPETGDALQRTTTGLAYQRKGADAPMFTNGHQFWVLSEAGVADGPGRAFAVDEPPRP
jgi:hypothetical protein